MEINEHIGYLTTIAHTKYENNDDMTLLNLAIRYNYDFLQTTNSALQKNLFSWPESQVDDYTERTSLYALINIAFNGVINNRIDNEILDKAHAYSETLLERLINQFDAKINGDDKQISTHIIENVLIPHALVYNLLTKYKE